MLIIHGNSLCLVLMGGYLFVMGFPLKTKEKARQRLMYSI